MIKKNIEPNHQSEGCVINSFVIHQKRKSTKEANEKYWLLTLLMMCEVRMVRNIFWCQEKC